MFRLFWTSWLHFFLWGGLQRKQRHQQRPQQLHRGKQLVSLFASGRRSSFLQGFLRWLTSATWRFLQLIMTTSGQIHKVFSLGRSAAAAAVADPVAVAADASPEKAVWWCNYYLSCCFSLLLAPLPCFLLSRMLVPHMMILMRLLLFWCLFLNWCTDVLIE